MVIYSQAHVAEQGYGRGTSQQDTGCRVALKAILLRYGQHSLAAGLHCRSIASLQPSTTVKYICGLVPPLVITQLHHDGEVKLSILPFILGKQSV